MRRRKVSVLVLFLCVSIAVTTIGVRNLFADEWISCEETYQQGCDWFEDGCYANEGTITGCIIVGCVLFPHWYDCTLDP